MEKEATGTYHIGQLATSRMRQPSVEVYDFPRTFIRYSFVPEYDDFKFPIALKACEDLSTRTASSFDIHGANTDSSHKFLLWGRRTFAFARMVA